jgi:hypothetical protein
MIEVATSPLWHPVFDAFAWASGGATGWSVHRWRLRGMAGDIRSRLGPGYFLALAAGAVSGAWMAGSLSTLRQAGPDPVAQHRRRPGRGHRRV